MFVAWGPELGFLYNDPYAEILGGKHPSALGRRFEDIWQEIWSDIHPIIEQALAGQSSFHSNLPLTVQPQGLRRAGLVHVFLLAGARRERWRSPACTAPSAKRRSTSSTNGIG